MKTGLVIFLMQILLINGCMSKDNKSSSDYRLNDIWVMQKMTGVELQKEKLPKGPPTFEFHLLDNRFLCNTGCNSISGEIEITGNHISFSKVVSTRMFCPDMEAENAIIKTISDKTLTYKIENLKLILEDEKGIKIFLKKVD